MNPWTFSENSMRGINWLARNAMTQKNPVLNATVGPVDSKVKKLVNRDIESCHR